jgi:ribonuclease R
MKKKTKHKSKIEKRYAGTIDIARNGMGFVQVENLQDDIVVRPDNFNTALHGDKVEVEIETGKPNNKRTYGRITKIIKRRQTQFIGEVQIDKFHGMFFADTDKPMPSFFVHKNNLLKAKDGDKVIAELTHWEKGKYRPEGKIIAVLSNESANEQAMQQIALSGGFPLSFSNEAHKEAKNLTDKISKTELKTREDFRGKLTFTIDPIDAKDFDDAISFVALDANTYEVGVHIADVSHYVTPGSLLDEEAYLRATSVYLPDRVYPMLPERISNELCSLRPNEVKRCFSAIFNIHKDGNVKAVRIAKTIIYSNHRYTYEDAQQIIESKKGVNAKEILLLNKLAQQFRKERFAKGAINFSSQEVRFKLDEKAKPIEVVVKESKEAHQLIEEFMLMANQAVAIKAAGVKIDNELLPFPYRVHDEPDKEKLKGFMVFAKKYGYNFKTSSGKEIADSFNTMLKAVQGKPEQPVLEQLGIRTMAKAVYTTNNIGHYGLGFEFYSHFTSPIRRYPDILAHRVLEQILNKEIKADKKMEQRCKHCSERERAAMEAERSANKYKQVEYMQVYVGQKFAGVITGVTSFGLFVETIDQKCEGLVAMSYLLLTDNFEFIEAEYALVGSRSKKSYRMGDTVNILVVAANLEKRQLDYELA